MNSSQLAKRCGSREDYESGVPRARLSQRSIGAVITRSVFRRLERLSHCRQIASETCRFSSIHGRREMLAASLPPLALHLASGRKWHSCTKAVQAPSVDSCVAGQAVALGRLIPGGSAIRLPPDQFSLSDPLAIVLHFAVYVMRRWIERTLSPILASQRTKSVLS